MKQLFPWKIYSIFFILVFLNEWAHAVDWKEHPYDKISHVAAGSVISCAVTYKTEKPLYGFLAGLAVGAIKETTDKNWDNGDFASWGVGGAIGTICIKLK